MGSLRGFIRAATAVACASAAVVTVAERPAVGGPGTCVDPRPVSANESGLANTRPSAAHWPGLPVVQAVVGAVDGGLYHAGGDPYPPGEFSGWRPILAPPGGFVGDPAAVALSRKQNLHVFVRGADDRLWLNFSRSGTGIDGFGWMQPFAEGVLASSPAAASRGIDDVDVAVVGLDGGVWHRFYDNYLWNHDWIPLGKPPGGDIVGSPALVAPGGDELHLFVRSVDGTLWQRFYRAGQWSGWFQPPGTEAGRMGGEADGPGAASSAPGQLSVFVRGIDDGLWSTTWHDQHWSPWQRHGAAADVIASAPSPAARAGRIDVFALGTNSWVYDFPLFCD